MFRRVLKWFGIAVLAGLAVAYFCFAELLYSEKRSKERCDKLFVRVLDKEECGFVTKEDVLSMIKSYSSNPIGVEIRHINTDAIESLLNRRSAIKSSQVYITLDGNLHISITQRKPVLRIQTENGGFYVDDTEFIFPLEKSYTSYVPVITGNIPLQVKENQRGALTEKGSAWIKRMTLLGNFLQNNSFWGDQIEQIYIDEKGDLVLFPRSGPRRIVFGDAGGLEEKFTKLYAFYSQILPVAGWERYREVNLKYRGQIVCTKEKKNKREI